MEEGNGPVYLIRIYKFKKKNENTFTFMNTTHINFCEYVNAI